MSRDLFDSYTKAFESRRETVMTVQEYLEGCKKDPLMFAGPHERLLAAIGEPEMIDTSRDSRLGRIHSNRTIRVYPRFSEFYGMEETIERIVAFFRQGAQGLEERKQILYLLGPVGGGKSSLAERIKALMEDLPIYVLKAGNDLSPVFESPLVLFDPETQAEQLQKDYGIPRRRLTGLMSPWALKRLDEFCGDITKFRVAKVKPSRMRQIGVAKVEPGDENNQDVSSLVGKVDIRKLEMHSQSDPDAYAYSGGLNRANQGVLEFVEMFKAPIKMLHPLLTATQEGNYVGSENIGAIPFTGIVMAHSNESEWRAFKNNKTNEAFIDRIYVIKVPYALRVTEEDGIVFLDEIDKIASRSERAGADVSREGVQRDLLPLIEGTTVATKHGPVKTDHILFIASGAFHVAKPSDLLPELQGRLPIRVELTALGRDDLKRILTEPEASLITQYTALMKTEGVNLSFAPDSIEAIADIAVQVNDSVENIGARRLHTVLERVLDEISFTASEKPGEAFEITGAYVREKVAAMAGDKDLSKYIL